MTFRELLRNRIVVFDGAMGTAIHARNLSLDDFRGKEGCSEVLVLSRPDVVREIHASYFEAGSQVVETNTFGATRIVLAEYQMADRVRELNVAAARLAREVAAQFPGPRFVAGSIGPSTKMPSLGHISFAEMAEAYEEQARALIEGGVDLLLMETCQDILQAKCAIYGVNRARRALSSGTPAACQVTLDTNGAMLLGTEIGAALATLEPFDLEFIGLNCATGPELMNDAVRYLGDNCPRPISCQPNAGIPRNEGGRAVFPLSPEELGKWQRLFVTEYGVSVVGGCCGTTPAHLEAVVEAVAGLEPRRRQVRYTPSVASCYTATPLDLDPKPVIIAEEMNTTTQAKRFRELVQSGNYDEVLALARRLHAEGSHLLDLCVAIVGEDEKKYMREVTARLGPRIQAPLAIDSTEAEAVLEALRRIPGRPIVNSINLEDGEKRTSKMLPMVRDFGAAVIALTIDEEGMALTADKKVAIAKRIYKLATGKYGLRPGDLIFDALTLPVSTGQEEYRTAGRETIAAVRRIKAELPGVFTVLGASNISFGLDVYPRRVLNSVFLHEAVEAGLDLAIINYAKIYPLHRIPEPEAALARKLVYYDTSDGQPLQNYIRFFAGGARKPLMEAAAVPPGGMPLEEEIRRSIINGEMSIARGGAKVPLQALLDEALRKYTALEIINTILLEAMRVVGELFGARKMQLPSVLDSARVMKAAVGCLEPHLERVEGASRGKIVLATVKGDVHDIGKNLVDIILTNNGFTVINLGIKQPSESIIRAALEHQADAIGLSGLLVKSTVEMKYVLEDLERQRLSYPVICGGAALNRKYVEEDLRSVYSHAVFYGEDAFAGLRTMNALVSPGERQAALAGGRAAGQRPAATAGTEPGATPGPLPPSPAIRRDVDIPRPPFWGVRVVAGIGLDAVFPYINLTALFKNQWQLRTLSKPDYEEAVRTKYSAILAQWQQRAKEERILAPQVVYGYFAVQSAGNDLIIYGDDEQGRELLRFTFPRQKTGRGLCLADFFLPAGSGRRDVAAFSLVTVGPRATEYEQGLFAANKYSDYLYLHGLGVETAEALAEYWHKVIREELGIAGEDSPEITGLFHQKYRGSRYSFGYPACPDLADQVKLLQLLGPEQIGVSLTEGYQLVPEQSTSAIVVHHPQAKYFMV
jgi:5-methyltetrahydrofolate--homocysteine methyltransferase